MVAAGKLRHRIGIGSTSITRNADGDVDDASLAIVVATVWGAIEPLTGREHYDAQAAGADVTHKITMRHGATVGPKTRLVNDSRTFEVVSVRNIDERDHTLVIMAKEVT